MGNDVWIGQHVTVLPGVHIGDVYPDHEKMEGYTYEAFARFVLRHGETTE